MSVYDPDVLKPMVRVQIWPGERQVRVSLWEPGSAAVSAVSPRAEWVEVTRRARAQLTVSSPQLLLPGANDQSWTRAEAKVGEELGALAFSQGPLRDRMRELLGAARARGESLRVVIEAAPPLSALPWELVALDPEGPLEALGDARIVRLLPGRRRAAAEPRRSTVEAWAPDPEDDKIAKVLAELRDLHSKLGLEEAPGDAGILHLVCHGLVDGEQVRLLTPHGELTPETVGHALQEPLLSTWLTVLDVCHGARGVRGVVPLLLRAGCVAVIASSSLVRLDVRRRFTSRLYASLARGDALPEAVGAARAKVRSMGLMASDERWWRTSLSVSDLAALDSAPLSVREGLPGWPLHAPELDAVVEEALEGARTRGFLGVETLALAILLQNRDQRSVELASWIEWLRGGRLSRVVGLYSSRGRQVVVMTPRMREIGKNLSSGFTARELLERLAADERGPLRRWCGEPPPTPLNSVDFESLRSASRAPGTGWALEVSGGPEDGRLLRGLQAGERVARSSSSRSPRPRDRLLYRSDCAARDLKVSRDGVFEIVAPHQIRALKPIGLLRDGAWAEFAKGSVLLVETGDLLKLSEGTVLAVIDTI